MIPHIKKIKLLAIVLFSLSSLSCKDKLEKEIESKNSNSENLDSKFSNVTDEIVSNDNEAANYHFYYTYFQSGGDTDLPEVSEEEIIEKFKKMQVIISKNSISLDGVKSLYTIEKGDSKKFFGRKYVYNYNVDVYKNFFNVDLSNEVTYLNLDVENNDLLPFQDYFLEAGDAIFENDCLFLNYKRYIICFKKNSENKVWDKKYCELPFDYERVDRSCQRDLRSRYSELCNNEYPITYFKNDDKLKIIIQDKLKNKNPLQYYNLKTSLKDIQTIILVCEHEEESYGDQFIVTLNGNKIISVLTDETNDFFHSMNFVIDNDLKITFYENNGIHPKNKIVNVYKINSDGSFLKVK
ncbi:hypothetical protein [Flavobacterium sp.]|uniref:hypothetical protein n=1 Tax=Flavobacterium sp. TaxID=239 RepID=UPI00286D1316|nr:hypothetical protein [Flavobacterium sp.]